MPPNVWPSEVPGFRETFEELYAAFEVAGGRILQAIALHLGLDRALVRRHGRRTAIR